MLDRVKNRLNEDKGNAVIILGIMLIGAFLLVGGMMLDLGKAQQMKSSYIDSAKKATQTAIMEQSSEGYLKAEAIGKAIYTYESVMRPSVINVDGEFAQCFNYGPEKVNIEVELRNEKGKTLSIPPITRAEVRSKVIDGEGRENSRMNSEILTQAIVSDALRREIIKGKYTEILLKVTEGTENAVLPGAFAITQAEKERAEGIRCQKMKVAARANIYRGGQQTEGGKETSNY